MVKIEFTNASVDDDGYGLRVNGKSLEHIISTALGTRVDSHYGKKDNLSSFSSNCCNVTVIIDPQPVTTHIEDDDYVYDSVEDLEEEKRGKYQEKNPKADPEE